MTVDLRFVVDLIETLRKLCMDGMDDGGRAYAASNQRPDACGFNWFKHSAARPQAHCQWLRAAAGSY